MTVPPSPDVTPPAPEPTAAAPAPSAPPPATPPALALRDLTKVFGQQAAVWHLNLDVPQGSMFGFVGPNGAGKTTTLSMATGLLQPTGGGVWIGGLDLWANPAAAKAKIGVLPDGLRLFDRLSGQELLTYTGLLRGLDPAVIRERSAQLLRAFDLDQEAKKAVADYSAGMTKKIGLAAALLHAPDLLVLDEPFEAIDPVSAHHITDILQGYVQGGGTVILSSHVMDTVERLCDHVAIIAQGTLRAAGPIAQVAAGQDLTARFFELVGGVAEHEELTWLRPSSN
jgi:ABC-2 type transport system ATP-binding protein